MTTRQTLPDAQAGSLALALAFSTKRLESEYVLFKAARVRPAVDKEPEKSMAGLDAVKTRKQSHR